MAAAIVSAALAFASGADAADWSLEQLMGELAQVKSSRARFTERKEMAILSAPLESSGTLVYVAPDRVEKHALAPRRESLVLEGGRLTLENKDRGQRRTFALQEYPVIWAFVESIRSTLAGDLATLKRFYRVTLQGDERDWRLTLVPIEPGMRKVVSEILIGGSRGGIDTIEITETQGDRSLMSIKRDGP